MSLNVNNNVGYDIVGNPTIVDGVASGFSADDYFKINGLNWSSSIKLEFVCRFKVDTSLITFTNNYTNICYWPFATYLYIGGNTSPTTIVPSSDFIGVSGGISYGKIPTNQYYWIKLETDGNGNATTYSSEDGTTWTQKGTKDISSTTTGVYSIAFGMRTNTGGFPGSIDLNETYIKVNGVTWFNGKQQASTTVNEVYLNRNVGYTAVGNPTIVDGVASGFSADDYVRTVKNFPTSNISTLEWGCKFTTGSNVNYQAITGTSAYWGCYGFGLGDYGALTITLSFSPNIILRFPVSTIKSNSTYISKAYWNATTKEFSAKVSGDNGETWTTSSMVVSDDFSYRDVPVQFGKTQAGNFRGSIDLNETYIKVNGVTWFSGKEQASPTVNEVYLNRNVGYEVVGNPTIVDGVASGFSASNYCAVSSAFIDSGGDLELCVTFTTNTIANKPIFGVTNGYNNQRPMLSLYSSGGKVKFKIANEVELISGGYNISAGVKYKAIVSRSGTTYTLKLYSGEILLDTQTLISETLIGNGASNTFAIGFDRCNYNTGFDNGSIDLNETYIKVNGVTWFNGKQTATTPVWTRSV